MSTVEAPREQEQVIGILTSVVVKGTDKWQAVVQPDGSQYTKNLWTKDANLVSALMSQIGNRLAFLCNASHWTMNDGTPVRSLWVEAAGSPGTVAQPQPPAFTGPPQTAQAAPTQAMLPQPQTVIVQPQVQPMGATAPAASTWVNPEVAQQQFTPHPDLREQKIHRQTAAKVAAIMLGYLEPGERNMSNLLVISERLVAYFDNGMPKTLEQELRERGMIQPQSVDANRAEGAPMFADEHEGPGDDDIPF